MSSNYQPDVELRKTVRNYACVICDERWPEKQMRVQDGIESDRRCPNHWEPNGGSIARDLDRAAASELAASITAKYAEPPKFPFSFDNFDACSAVSLLSPSPRRLTAGGSAAVLTITGTRLLSTDTIVYGHVGITNSIAAVLTPVTYDGNGNALTPFVDTLTLTVVASGAVPPGLYTLLYNSSIFRNVFDVRA